MSQFRLLSQSARGIANESLKHLMYGLDYRIDLDSIKDRLSEQKEGYSFLKDPANRDKVSNRALILRACLDIDYGLMFQDS